MNAPLEREWTYEELIHFGVKGMRWGFRKETSSKPGSARDIRRETPESAALRIGSTRKDFAESRKDAKFERKTTGVNPFTLTSKANRKLEKAATKSMKPEVKQLNKKPQYSTKYAKRIIKKNIYNPESPDPLVKAYHKELSAIYMKHVEMAAEKQLKISPSGKWEQYLDRGKNYWTVDIRRTSIKHADILDLTDKSDIRITFKIKPIYDNDGYIVDFEFVEDSMAQAEKFVKNILKHERR